MPDIPQLVAAIDSRLADIAAEISALDAAKAELSAPRSRGQAPAITSDATATRRRPGRGAVGAETLERLLADTSAGLSAKAIAAQAGAGYDPTLKLLGELEAAGQVRRSGSRRSTVWRLISDEERIAERAAELELLSSASRQRRGRARAS
jgi:hypothetical protein